MESNNRLQHIIDCLIEYRKLWLLPAIGGLLLATVYAFFVKGDTWTARQSMIIRDDLLGDNFKPGSFVSEEAMKSAHDRVLESARRPEVIHKVLQQLGPERSSLFGLGGAGSDWPSDDTVNTVRGSISFESANGGEYGKSELVVLAAKDANPQRAQKFISLLLDEVDDKLSEIQSDQFESMEAELRATCDSALQAREDLEARVMRMEADLGNDISIVRSMNESGGGSPSAFETKMNEILLQRREASRDVSAIESLKRSLAEARESSLDELPTSAELLNSQPALANLVQSLAVAKQNLSEAEGLYRPAHPQHRAATEQVASIKSQIRRSLGTVVRGLDGQLASLHDRVALLDGLLKKNEETLQRVSRLRVPYTTAIKELDKQTEDFGNASARLANMQSRKASSDSINLVTRIGEPVIGPRPDGLAKRALSVIGGIAGLLIGLGLVMIVAPPFQETRPDSGPDEDLAERLNYRLPEAPQPPAPMSRPPQQRQPAEPMAPTQTSQPAASIAQTPQPVPPVPQPVAPTQPVAPASQQLNPSQQSQSGSTSTPPVHDINAAVQSSFANNDAVPAQAPVAQTSQLSVPSVALTSEPEPPAATPSSPVNRPPARKKSSTTILRPEDQPTPLAEEDSARQASSTTDSTLDAVEQKTAVPTKSLASIFASMPQPRRDIAVDASPTQSQSEDEPSKGRERAQTIELDKGSIPSNPDAIPLQRRTTYRPVDLAKEESRSGAQPPVTDQESIDDVFSELKEPKTKSTN